jgi:hypothetical protein
VVQAVAKAMKRAQIAPSFMSYGCGIVAQAAISGFFLLRIWDLIGLPGGPA